MVLRISWTYSHFGPVLALVLTRSSRPEVFCRKGVPQNSQENTSVEFSILIKLGLGPASLFKKRLRQRCFHVKIAKFLRTRFFLQAAVSDLRFKYENLIQWNLSIVDNIETLKKCPL